MTQFARNLYRTAREVLGSNTSHDEAWIDAETLLTPRETLLRDTARVLQWGAFAHVIAFVVLALAAITGSALSLKPLLMGGFAGADNTAIIVAALGVGINLGMLLLLTVGVLAQEFWVLPMLGTVLFINLGGLLFVRFTPALVVLIPCGWALTRLVRDMGAFHLNPVATKELRGRMRGVRAFAIITVFLAMMGSFTVLLYIIQLPSLMGGRTIITGELGRVLFSGVFIVELLMIIFIVPALTAGAVTGERERKTYDLLQTTLLPAPAFIVGKMESAIGYILLLLLSAIPLQSIAFLFGGISEVEVGVAFIILAATAILLGAMGLYFSAQTERTLTATIRSYTVALVVIGVISLLALIYSPFGRKIAGLSVEGVSGGMETALIYGDMLLMSANPLTAGHFTQQMLINHQEGILLDVQLTSTGTTIPVFAPWIVLVVMYLILAGLLVLLAVRRMRRSGSG